jgi:hypothetical protein
LAGQCQGPSNQTALEVVEKELQLGRKYHLRPERIMRYLEHYRVVKSSDTQTQWLEQAAARNTTARSSYQTQ